MKRNVITIANMRINSSWYVTPCMSLPNCIRTRRHIPKYRTLYMSQHVVFEDMI